MIAEAGLAALWLAAGLAALQFLLMIVALRSETEVIRAMRAIAVVQGALTLIAFAMLRWVIIGSALLLGLAVIYRFGPDVNAKFRFISPGNVVAAILIALISIGVQFYVQEFGKNYNATYGSLGAVIILMLWLYLAGVAILAGGEINKLLSLDSSTESKLGGSAD